MATERKRYPVYDPSALRRAIAGDTLDLCLAFVWAESPKGVKYWDKQYHHLTIRGKQRLRNRLRAARRAEAKRNQET